MTVEGVCRRRLPEDHPLRLFDMAKQQKRYQPPPNGLTTLDRYTWRRRWCDIPNSHSDSYAGTMLLTLPSPLCSSPRNLLVIHMRGIPIFQPTNSTNPSSRSSLQRIRSPYHGRPKWCIPM